MTHAATRQRSFEFRAWGGARAGAGRPPKGERAGVAHARRAPFRSLPVHVTLRLRDDAPRIRKTRMFRALARVFRQSRERFGMRLNHYSVQGNHVHLLVEAYDRGALTRGMRALTIRMALTINRVVGRRRGKVFADRFHAHVLRTLAETKNAVSYVLGNRESHWRRAGNAPLRS